MPDSQRKTSWARTIWSAFVLMLLFAICTADLVAQHTSKPKSGKEEQSESSPRPVKTQDGLVGSSEPKPQVQLKLIDGTSLSVDSARESEQGIWYQKGGVTYLISRERIKTMERSPGAKPAIEPQVASVTVVGSPEKLPSIQPVWIHLVGGARVEADSAIESVGGVWYRRGSLTVFIERSRVERVEREDLEKTKQSESAVKERGWTTGNAKIDVLIKQNGAKHQIDPYLIFCVMEQESHFSARVVSPKGARGLMQLMPGTSARFGVRHPFNPAENISAGARYLKQLFDQFNGRVDLVLASYNAGEGAVIKFGHKVPPYRETRDYVKKISYRYRRGA